MGDFGWVLTAGRVLSAAALVDLDTPFCLEPEGFFSERKLSLSESIVRRKDNSLRRYDYHTFPFEIKVSIRHFQWEAIFSTPKIFKIKYHSLS